MSEFIINPKNLTVEFTISNPITDDSGIIIDTKIIPVIMSQEQANSDSITAIAYNIKEHLNDENIKIYENICYSVGKINRLAEINCDRLRYFIYDYFLNRNYKSYFRKSDKTTQEIVKYNISNNFNKLTYRQLVNILKYVIENDKNFQKNEEIDTPEKRESFIEYYYRFVENRNILTHGIICISLPDKKVLCRAIINNTEDYREITEESIVSTHQVFHYLGRVIDKKF